MVIGPMKFLGKGIFFLFRLVSKYWIFAFTLIIIMSGLISSINEGVEQKDMRIPLNFIGNSFVFFIFLNSDFILLKIFGEIFGCFSFGFFFFLRVENF